MELLADDEYLYMTLCICENVPIILASSGSGAAAVGYDCGRGTMVQILADLDDAKERDWLQVFLARAAGQHPES